MMSIKLNAPGARSASSDCGAPIGRCRWTIWALLVVHSINPKLEPVKL
ncbi:MAG: hypothetical protein ABIY70_21425 [Capsulimonas sp.]